MDINIGDKFLCIKDRTEFVWCGCLYNGDRGCRGTMKQPISKEEIKTLNGGESYYFRFNIKDNIYEVGDITILPNSGKIVRIKTEHGMCETIEPDKLNEFFISKSEMLNMRRTELIDKMLKNNI